MISTAPKSLISDARIFQVFVGRWQSANSNDHRGQVFQKLSSLPFKNLKNLGINTIYLLGIFDNQGPIIVKNEDGVDLQNCKQRLPSPFAITNHKSPNPDLGSIEDLTNLIKYLHAQKFTVIVDFVPNHTGTAHPWVTGNPDYYATKNGEIIKEFSGDVYKLNYENQNVREEMMGVVEHIASLGVDGVRCDMAHLVPQEFWKTCVGRIKSSHPNFMFIAEAYSDSPFSLDHIGGFINLGFDGVYHQALYHNFENVYKLHQPKNFLIEHCNYIRTRNDIKHHLVNYLSNHDDNFPGNLETDFSEALGTILGMPGAAIMYNGSLNGRFNRLAHHCLDILPDNQNEVFHIPANISNIFSNFQPNIIVLDVGGSKIEAALVDRSYRVHASLRQPTIKSSFQDFIQQIASIIEKLKESARIEAIALAVPGIITPSGVIEFSGGTLHILRNVNLKAELSQYFSLPIFIENDANCFAFGEAILGAGKNYQTVVGITWGTGIGSGIVINQNLYRGAGAAGEIGHIPISTTKQSVVCGCGKANCVESYASGSAIQNQYQELGGKIDGATVADIVKSDEIIATSIIEQAVIFMAEGISAVINMLDPDIIVIGGGLSHIEDKVFSKLEGMVKNYQIKSSHQTIIVKHQLPNAALVGAAKLARENNYV